jgi:hypothetical protein
VRPGRDPFPLLTRLQAAVEVVDARIQSHVQSPDVVREGEAYSLFVTVTNLSRATQKPRQRRPRRANTSRGLTAPIRRTRSADDPDAGARSGGDARVPSRRGPRRTRRGDDLPVDLVGGQGTIRLRTGVGELGIPLFAGEPGACLGSASGSKPPYLANEDLYRAHIRFLGLAYSLAVAPAALTPARPATRDQERASSAAAVDFAQAGMRTYLHEGAARVARGARARLSGEPFAARRARRVAP